MTIGTMNSSIARLLGQVIAVQRGRHNYSIPQEVTRGK